MSYFVYWLHTPGMRDILSQGYIGISYDPEVRFRQHKSFALSGYRYPSVMRESFISGDVAMIVLLQASKEYCVEIERRLRPATYIGWNKAIGGDGGIAYKHGLSCTKCKSTYHNLKNRANSEGKLFQWSSVEEFKPFYDEIWSPCHVFYLEDLSGDYNEGNLSCMPRADYLRTCQRSYEMDGVSYSVSELADLSGIKPNTISTRLKRGWSVKEATYGRS